MINKQIIEIIKQHGALCDCCKYQDVCSIGMNRENEKLTSCGLFTYGNGLDREVALSYIKSFLWE